MSAARVIRNNGNPIVPNMVSCITTFAVSPFGIFVVVVVIVVVVVVGSSVVVVVVVDCVVVVDIVVVGSGVVVCGVVIDTVVGDDDVDALVDDDVISGPPPEVDGSGTVVAIAVDVSIVALPYDMPDVEPLSAIVVVSSETGVAGIEDGVDILSVVSIMAIIVEELDIEVTFPVVVGGVLIGDGTVLLSVVCADENDTSVHAKQIRRT